MGEGRGGGRTIARLEGENDCETDECRMNERRMNECRMNECRMNECRMNRTGDGRRHSTKLGGEGRWPV